MRNSNGGTGDRGSMERVGESVGAMAGRAADWGMEMTGALFRTASDTLGGWWASDAPSRVATDWSDRAEKSCRSHYQAAATGGATQATNAAPKSQHAAMQSAGEVQVGDTKVSGEARLDTSSARERTASPESASDGFERVRPGYQLGYVARQNPAYKGRSFNDVEPELRRVWESGARTEGSAGGNGGSWPEVRGFVDFAYQQGDDR